MSMICIPCGHGKTYQDLKIAWIKKYGIMKFWRDYCRKLGFYLYKDKTVEPKIVIIEEVM